MLNLKPVTFIPEPTQNPRYQEVPLEVEELPHAEAEALGLLGMFLTGISTQTLYRFHGDVFLFSTGS